MTKQTRAIGPDVPLADALALLLGEEFELFARAQEAHWNVTGPDFAEWHGTFGDLAADAHGAVDPLAENIRKLGSLAPALSVEPSEARQTDALALAAELLDESEELAEACRAAFDIATAAGQQGIANYLADRQDAHAKFAWMLRSSLGVAEVGEPVAVEAEADEVEEPGEVETNGADLDAEVRRSLIADAEKRTFTVEVRAAEGNRIGGYAAMFDREADGLPFKEVIKPGAFKRSLDRGDDCFLLVNHDADALPLARRSAGTLDVFEDEVGLRFDAELDPENPAAASLLSAIRRGDVDKCSFAFRVAEGGSTKSGDVRELRNLDLFEVSVVTWPAYSATTVGMRSADDGEDLAEKWLAARWQHARTTL